MAESTDLFLLGSATTPPPHCTFEIAEFYGEKPIFGRIYGFCRTEFGYYPLPPPPTLDSRYFARAEWTSAERTFSATTRNLMIFRNSDWATLQLMLSQRSISVPAVRCQSYRHPLMCLQKNIGCVPCLFWRYNNIIIVRICPSRKHARAKTELRQVV